MTNLLIELFSADPFNSYFTGLETIFSTYYNETGETFLISVNLQTGVERRILDSVHQSGFLTVVTGLYHVNVIFMMLCKNSRYYLWHGFQSGREFDLLWRSG